MTSGIQEFIKIVEKFGLDFKDPDKRRVGGSNFGIFYQEINF